MAEWGRGKYAATGRRLMEAEAMSRWEKVVGSTIAKYAKPIRVRESILWVEVNHPIWGSELQHRKKQILDLLNKAGGVESSARPLKDITFVTPHKR